MQTLINNLEQTEQAVNVPNFLKLNSKFAKVIRNHTDNYGTHDLCGYIYKDGVLAIEKKIIKQGKYENTIEVYHIQYCNIPISINKYNDVELTRIVCHEPSMLLDGINKLSIYIGNKSESMEKRNLTCTTLQLTTLSMARYRFDIFDFLSSDYTIQFKGSGYHKFDSLHEIANDAEYKEIYQ